ncbi:MAG: hypothetical protein FGM32_10500 [Candidatus Kapabacteria bacterium]|nr:hypothetical protein [Candidatus Kapabacteria bacterium]
MEARVRIVPWIEGRCSMYAVVRDGVCLAQEFVSTLRKVDSDSERRLMRLITALSNEALIRPAQLRPERPDRGVFAMYNHREWRGEQYNPSRLLCSYVGAGNRTLLFGAGFVKTRDEPIQSNPEANREAVFLADIAQQVDLKIDHGEILVVGAELIPLFADSFHF